MPTPQAERPASSGPGYALQDAWAYHSNGYHRTNYKRQTMLPPYIRKGSDLHVGGPNALQPASERAGSPLREPLCKLPTKHERRARARQDSLVGVMSIRIPPPPPFDELALQEQTLLVTIARLADVAGALLSVDYERAVVLRRGVTALDEKYSCNGALIGAVQNIWGGQRNLASLYVKLSLRGTWAIWHVLDIIEATQPTEISVLPPLSEPLRSEPTEGEMRTVEPLSLSVEPPRPVTPGTPTPPTGSRESPVFDSPPPPQMIGHAAVGGDPQFHVMLKPAPLAATAAAADGSGTLPHGQRIH
jgi:hypothetical protein